MNMLNAYYRFRRLAVRLAKPLKDGKIRVAIATLAVLYWREMGYEVSEDFMLAVLVIGSSLILGTAIENGHANGKGNHPGRS